MGFGQLNSEPPASLPFNVTQGGEYIEPRLSESIIRPPRVFLFRRNWAYPFGHTSVSKGTQTLSL